MRMMARNAPASRASARETRSRSLGVETLCLICGMASPYHWMPGHGKGSEKSSSADRGEELVSESSVIPEGPQHVASDHAAAMGADAARCHAAMFGHQQDGNSVGIERPVNGRGDVTGQALLNLQAA